MPDISIAPGARVDVLGAPKRPHRSADVTALFGRDIVVDPGVLSDYCFQSPDRRVDDLLHVAAAAGFADRAIRRSASRAWRRRIELRVAVHEPEFWRQPAVVEALAACLDLVTGDVWTFAFSAGRTPLTVTPQAPLELRHGPAVVMPFSDGLDSLAVARLTSLREPASTLILVTTGGKQDVDRAFRLRHLNGRRHRVSFPFTFPKDAAIRLDEPSFRSRGFVFGVAAGVAAHLLEADRVIFGESGQGSLGPWLAPVGNEAPDVRMHPMFTQRITRLLQLVLGRRIEFEHPYLWATKRQTLAWLCSERLADDWWETRSCARDQRHMSLAGRRVQCGICAACLLRRQSLHAADLQDQRDIYMWPDLSAATLAEAAAPGARPSRPNDERQGMCGVLALDDFARLAKGRAGADRVSRAADTMASALGLLVPAVEANLTRLVHRHRDEWASFVAAQGDHSFIARWAKAARC